MSTAKTLEVQGWELVVGEDDRPMVRDVDLGARLGFARPRKFRELVARLIATGALQASEWRPTVGRQTSTGRGGHRGPVTEYHLSQRGALIAIAKSDTPLADTITRQMVDVFMAYLEGRAPAAPGVTAVPIAEIHGSRIGETAARAELVAWSRLAAASLEVTLHRVHGALRRQYKVASPYHLSLSVWPTARAFLEALATKRLFLEAPARPAPLRLLQGGAQLAMPWGGR